MVPHVRIFFYSNRDNHRKTAVVIDVVIPSDSGIRKKEHEMVVPVATGGLRAVMPKLLIFENGEKDTVLDSCAPENIFRCTNRAIDTVHYEEIYLLSFAV